jgi:hypothetical protein
MKKLITASLFVIASALYCSPSFSQIRKIPSAATEALKEKYPEAANVSWQDKLTVFVASFEMENAQYEARFNDKGEWKSTEKKIVENELPAQIRDGFEKSKYADWQLQEAYLIDLPNEASQYRVLVSKNDVQKKNLVFNGDGRLLRDNIALK